MALEALQDTPNPKVLSFPVESGLLLRKFSQVAFKKTTPELRTIFPFAAYIMEDVCKAVSAVDIMDGDKAYIGFTSVFASWSKSGDAVAKISSALEKHLAGTKPAPNEEEIINLKALPVFDFYEPQETVDREIEALFTRSITPILAKDGGSMVVKQIHISKEGQTRVVDVDVLTLGSCAGCKSSEEQTLKAAGDTISSFLKALKENNPNHPEYVLRQIKPFSAQNGFAVLRPNL